MMLVTAGVLLALVGAGVKCKMSNNMWRGSREQIITSPLAEAISQLVGISGGIYLALSMTMDFIGLNSDIKVAVGGCDLNALALLAIILACVQPVLVGILRKISQR